MTDTFVEISKLDPVLRDYLIWRIKNFTILLCYRIWDEQFIPMCHELVVEMIKKYKCKTYEQFKIVIFHFDDRLDLFKFDKEKDEIMYKRWVFVNNAIKEGKEDVIDLFI